MLSPCACVVTHGFTAVAELKRHRPHQVPVGVGRYPRLHRRGRIEARPRRPWPAPAARVTHGFTAVAELKRQQHPGPGVVLRRVTHGFTAVAELKHPYLPRLRGELLGYPRLHR